MAYQDSLFQLGMDLTRSSTAQKEDHGEAARVAQSLDRVSGRHDGHSSPGNGSLGTVSTVPSSNCIERPSLTDTGQGVESVGHHLIIDLFGASRLDDLNHIEQTLKLCVQEAEATLLHIHLQRFTPTGGVSGVAVMAGGHVSIYSWPETGSAAFDLVMHGDGKADACVEVLTQAFNAGRTVVKTSRRGDAAETRVAVERSGSEAATPRAKSRVRKAA